MAVDINLVALIISAAALIGTTLQALQQYAATSEGYRRCAPAVVGAWHRKRRRRFRWRELRFETLYAAPFIDFSEHSLEAPIPRFCNDISLMPSGIGEGGPWDERAGWLSMIECLGFRYSILKSLSQRNPKSTRHLLFPRVEELSRSWDFMPPDVVRPLAVCQVHSLVRIVRLLGLSWVQFDPISGTYRAEGNGQTITSSVIQGIGPVLQYTYHPPTYADIKHRIQYASPYHEADNLSCGILAYKSWCGTPIRIDSYENLFATMKEFFGVWDFVSEGKTGQLHQALSVESLSSLSPEINDLVAMTQPYMGVYTTSPSFLGLPDVLYKGSFGLELLDAASVSYGELILRLGATASLQVQWVHEQLSKLLHSSFKDKYDIFCAADDFLKERSFLGASHDGWMDPLLSAHVLAVFSESNRRMDFNNRLFKNSLGLGNSVCQWILKNHEEARPPFVTFLSLSEHEQQIVVEEAWLTMILRGRCWVLLHRVECIKLVGAQWLASSLPVYIG